MKSFTNEELKLLLLSVVNMYNEVNSKKKIENTYQSATKEMNLNIIRNKIEAELEERGAFSEVAWSFLKKDNKTSTRNKFHYKKNKKTLIAFCFINYIQKLKSLSNLRLFNESFFCYWNPYKVVV